MADHGEMPSTPFAGARSGINGGTAYMEEAMPIRGLIGETLKERISLPNPAGTPPRHPLGASLRGSGGKWVRDPLTAPGVADCETVRQPERIVDKVGCMPQLTVSRSFGSIPGYRGHIAHKEAENVHGGTFKDENLRAHTTTPSRAHLSRALSEPSLTMWETQGAFKVVPRMPGYDGNIPGKHSETVYGVNFGRANEVAQAWRRQNPYATCTSWLRKRSDMFDKPSSYNIFTRTQEVDPNPYFTKEEDLKAYKDQSRLGRTFGIKAKPHKAPSCGATGWDPRTEPNDPGGRYLHLHARGGHHVRLDPTTVPVAGKPSWSPILDQQRWQMHNALVTGNGNQRAVSGS